LPEVPDLSKGNTIGACFLYTRRVYEQVVITIRIFSLTRTTTIGCAFRAGFSWGISRAALLFPAKRGVSLLCQLPGG